MSLSAIAWAQAIDLGPRSGSRRALLLELADMMNRTTGQLNPKVSTLARKTGRSERCVQYGLRWLEKRAGLLTQLPQAGRRACHYVLHVGSPPGPNLHPEKACFAPQAGPNLHPEPSEDSNQGREPSEARAGARPPASSPVDEILVEGEESKEASRIEQQAPPPAVAPPRKPSARKTPWPDDDPVMMRMIEQEVIEGGYDPDELVEEMADWCRDNDHRSANWLAFARRWIRREGKFRRHNPTVKPSAGNRWDRPWLAASLFGAEARP